MKLTNIRLLTDENISPEVVNYLRGRGFDVFDVKEESLVGTSDLELIRSALDKQRLILTHDRDFGKLAISNMEPVFAIVFLRPGHIDPVFTIGSLQILFEQDLDIAPPFIIVVERAAGGIAIRVRQL